MDTIKCITIQHKNVVETLCHSGEYKARWEYVDGGLRRAYKIMMEHYRYSKVPIFMNPVGCNVEYYGTMKQDPKLYYLIELEVPKVHINFQEYYDWVDVIFFSKNPEEANMKLYGSFEEYCKKVFNKRGLDGKHVCQGTTQVISKKWVTEVMKLNRKFIREHVGSGGNNVLNDLSYYKSRM